MAPTTKARGIGGLFFRAKDPEALASWYNEHFAINEVQTSGPWMQDAGPTVFSPFPKDTDYFGRPDQMFMVNLRVDDLDATLAGLAKAGIPETKPRESMDGIGHFGWVDDPEGNRIELWEPMFSSE